MASSFKKLIAQTNLSLAGFSERLAESMNLIKRTIKKHRKPYVAFSGGKDSTVVFDLVKRIDKDVFGVWSDDEFFLPETGEYMNRMKRKNKVVQIRTNAKHCDWFQTKGSYDSIQDYARQHGFDLCYMGLRNEENKRRKINYAIRGDYYYVKRDNVYNCNPISKWSWRDVWTYIISMKLDYNRAYDRMDEIGIKAEEQRVGPYAVESILARGQLIQLRRGWPKEFERFARKYPEARKYV